MKSKTRSRRWWGRFLLFVLLFVPITHGGSAAAQDYTIAGEWEITFDVFLGEMRAVWIGRVWENQDGVETNKQLKVIDISESCTAHGAPVFAEDAVTLDGVDDYITCTIPDFQAIFGSMVAQLRNCRCRYEGPPYASADVSPVHSTVPQPVVYHERLHLEVMNQEAKTVWFPSIKTGAAGQSGSWQPAATRVGLADSLGLAQLTLHFQDGEVLSWQSKPFSVWQENGFQVWAGYNAARFVENNSPDGFNAFLGDSGFWDAVEPEYVEGLLFWESEAQTKYVDEPMPSGFGLGPGTEIFIGHNPVDNSFFEGIVRSVAIDPGCRGH